MKKRNKTLGNQAFDAFHKRRPTFSGDRPEWSKRSDEMKEDWETAASAIADECADAIKALSVNMPQLLLHLGEMTAAERRVAKTTLGLAVHYIRSLKSKSIDARLKSAERDTTTAET